MQYRFTNFLKFVEYKFNRINTGILVLLLHLFLILFALQELELLNFVTSLLLYHEFLKSVIVS